MSAAGWTIMMISVFGMTGLFGWCIFKVLTIPGSDRHIHSQSDIDPRDQE